MPKKKKKTLKQKRHSDFRKATSPATPAVKPQVQSTTVPEEKNTPKTTAMPVQSYKPVSFITDYRYVSTDLRKTAMVTGIIIVAEILIWYLVK